MTGSHTRRMIMFGAATIGATVAMASLAFACTTYTGKFTVAPDGGGAGTATGANATHQYCGTVAPATFTSSRDFSITVAPAASPCTGKLPSNIYDVNWTPVPVPWLVVESLPGDCMTGGFEFYPLGDITVDTNGNGTEAGYTLPSDARGEIGICVSDQGPGTPVHGNQLPAVIAI